MARTNRVAELNQLEQFLQQPDAVMEPNILDILRRYVSAGGEATVVVEMLSDNYVGYAHMASLVVGWAQILGDVDASLKGYDEAHSLRELAKQRFDPEKFSGVFSSGGSGPPKWLDGLAADRQGRQLIYELSAQHRASLLLNYAIQKILRAGHEDEVASVGTSLASYFSVFHRLLANRLNEVPDANEARLEALSAELKDTCCQSQHIYLHAQQLLSALGRQPGGARFARLSQELEAAAAALRGAPIWHMRRLFTTPDERPGLDRAAQLVAELLAASGASAGPSSTTAAQQAALVASLHELYSHNDPPPMDVLRHPRVFVVLLECAFAPAEASRTEQCAAHIGLLALAAAANDERPTGPLDLQDVQPTAEALRLAVTLAQTAAHSTKYGPREQAQAEAAADCPVAAAGLLHAMQKALGSVEYWRTYHGSTPPLYLNYLALIIPRQPLLLPQAVDAVAAALCALGNAKPDAARALLGLGVACLAGGAVDRMLSAAEDWAATADPSLVRGFVFAALAAVAPPYSPRFAAAMIRLMQGSGVKRSRSGIRDSRRVEALEEFAAEASRLSFDPPLPPREAAFLADLATHRVHF